MKYFWCSVCKGALHEALECPTKKKLDSVARATGGQEPLLWGAWKYKSYYAKLKAGAEGEVANIETRANKSAAVARISGKRTFGAIRKKRKLFAGKSFIYQPVKRPKF